VLENLEEEEEEEEEEEGKCTLLKQHIPLKNPSKSYSRRDITSLPVLGVFLVRMCLKCDVWGQKREPSSSLFTQKATIFP